MPAGPDLRTLRCFLFFPASRPELFEKAVATGVDGVCPDLEDAVGPGAKDAAREAVTALLEREIPDRAGDAPVAILRVNALDSDAGRRDVAALTGLAGRDALPDALLIPKVRAPESLDPVAELIEGRDDPPAVIALIETAAGLAAAAEIGGRIGPGGALMIGGHDLSLELGSRPAWEPLLYARSRVVHAAALAGIPALDMPLLELSDPDALAEEARAARELGFSGKAAVHPDQVETIQEALTPGADEVADARKIVEAYRESGGEAVRLGGMVVDQPVLEAALRTLARAGETP